MNSMNRRRFLASSVRATAGFAALGGVAGRRVLGANERPHVALIGCGGRGRYDARGIIAAGTRLSWLCDVDPAQSAGTAKFLERYAPDTKAANIRQTRHLDEVLEDDSVDAVIVATPDHWHATASVRAVLAGKDVYVEKPHAHSIHESEVMVRAAEKTGRLIQVGTQNRSGAYNHKALEYLRSGKLGPIHLVKVYNLKSGGPFRLGDPGRPPADFLWDVWLGPAPERPYHQRIVHGGWHHFWDYSGGDLCDDAAHQVDLALMLMGDPGLPRSVSSAGGRLAHQGDDSEVPDLLVSSFEFDGFVLTLEHSNYPKYMMKTTTSIRQGDKFPFWMHNATRIELYGTEQMMVVGRHGGGWQATIYPWEVMAQEYGRPCDDEHYA
ncbi:MAG: gfo/Idh/MocA family oxidoreductase, partial [Verrucomicrobia bacterium]